MGDRDNNNLIPFVAGVVVGAGILTLLYKFFLSSKPKKPLRLNQQINAPAKCTCLKGGSDPVSLNLNEVGSLFWS